MQGYARLVAAAALGASIAAAVVLSLYCEWKPDDAYISFVYARNWINGSGLVFNLGERVEGYTSFLWVALCALGLWLGADVRAWSTGLGIVCAIATILATVALARDLSSQRARLAAVLAAPLVAFYPGIAWWAGSGMETMLFTLLITCALWRHARDGASSVAAPLILAIASMTRPEAWLLASILCLDAWRGGSRAAAFRYVAIFLALFTPFFLWRWWYYGDLLPNTFYAKVGDTSEQLRRGARYLLDFLVAGRGALLLLGAAAILASPSRRRAAPILAFVVVYLTYVLAVGGDVFAGYRFAVPLVPVLAALFVAGVASWGEGRRPRWVNPGFGAAAMCVVLVLAACITPMREQRRVMQVSRAILELHHAPCEFVRQHTAAGDVVATAAVGVLKWCTDRRVVDMLGLTDEHIAHHAMPRMGRGTAGHERYDSAYVLARWPRYIVMPTPGNLPIFHIEAFDDMWRQPVLQRWYVPTSFGYRRIDADKE